MNNVLVKLMATGLLLVSYSSTADELLTVYGKANLTINDISLQPDVDEWQLNSNASRLGVKGSYVINEGLEAFYQIEFEVHLDDGMSSASKGKDTLEQRNTYAGLRGSFGTLIAGRHDTPLKLTQGKIDRFNDQVLGDFKNFIEGEDRLNNIVMYTSPSHSGFTIAAAVIAAENSENATDIDDGISLSLNYSNKGFSASWAHNEEIDKQDTTRVVTEYSLGNTNFGGLWQTAKKVDGSSEEDSWFVSAAHDLSPIWTIKTQYGSTDYGVSSQDSQFALGLDRKLSSSTVLFANYVNIERETASNSVDESSLAIGIEIKF